MAIAAVLVAASVVWIYQTNTAPKIAAQSSREAFAAALETALYTRTEFFGANAIVPLPTAEARKNLVELSAKYPNESEVFLKLAQFDERLGDFAAAEGEINRFVELSSETPESLETLVQFYERRANYEKTAATLERLLQKTTGERRVEIFTRLIETAHRHGLEKYLQPAFYRRVIEQDAASFAVVEKFIEKLITEENYAEALKFVSEAQNKFPAQQEFLLAKEIEILIDAKRETEAEAAYHRAFSPFWEGEKAEEYYQFLDEQNRLTAYKSELRAKFKQNPTDFDAAVRLFHAEENGYGDESTRILLKLEQERAKQNIKWQPDELLTVARLLLSAGEGDAAGRFLYTLSAANKLEKGGELRAKVIYQLFEIMSNAENERLALTAGNLDFYRDVASADSHPGITTGILSLIFADTAPAEQLKEKEQTAARLFNRAAAYRLFLAYKEENPASPQLAQMYLDIVRLYLVDEPELAAKILTEFEARKEFDNAPAYPIIALKLADAFVAAGEYNKERAVYQKMLDFLGKKQTLAKQPLVVATGEAEPTLAEPTNGVFPKESNQGINRAAKYVRYYDFIADETPQIKYAEVLNRYVASLNRDKQTSEILSLYARESAKYPNEAGLDEQMLQWLGETNLVEEQLKVYQAASKKFPGTIWQDRLARWFLRQRRSEDFEKFAEELIEKFDDAETQRFLTEFVNRNADKPENFNGQLFFALYTKAHRRFPHNTNFVKGLLEYYRDNEQDAEWRKLMAEYYFESPDIRNLFLEELAKNGKLRDSQNQAAVKIAAGKNNLSALPYKLFRADAAARLSNFEDAVAAYRELNNLYPNTPEYAERLIAFTRSLGQTNRTFLHEAAGASHDQAENSPNSIQNRIRAGEIQAELGDYPRARAEWQKLLQTGTNDAEIYRETATVFWDYFQYDDALQTIQKLRAVKRDASLYAFESGAIYEAKKDMPAALGEYFNALDGEVYGEYGESVDRAGERLETLYKRPGVPAQLQNVFAAKRTQIVDTAKRNAIVLGYASLLRRVKKWDEGKRVLATEIAVSNSENFLTQARELSRQAKDAESEQTILRRLAVVAKNPRAKMRFSLQLAESLSEKKKTSEAAQVLSALIIQFPNNYGVLRESADFYWRIGERETALRVLETAMQRGRGEYRTTFGRKLAARLLEQKNDVAAETILQQLYAENPLSYGVFQELTKIYVRTNNREKLSEIFNRTLSEIKAQNVGSREIDEQTASLRTSMINSLTRLKDYDAAIAQHIEIINRDPDDEKNTDAAISYIRRYGGAQSLIDYYQKTAAAAYKNYRWFVVLARIYEAQEDYPRAAENYRLAIKNQPEMVELYDALAALYEKQPDFNAAITALNRTVELSNDEPQYVRRLIGVLEKAGRKADADAAREKLPAEMKAKQTLAEQFTEAEKLKALEKEKALELYRAAYNAFAANPLEHELKTAEIVGYVKAVRGTERLDQTAAGLWALRDKLTAETEKSNSTAAGRARTQRRILDAAIIEAVGGAARDFAGSDERRVIFNDISQRLDALAPADAETLSALQNLSSRAGFGLITEKILTLQKERGFALKNTEIYHQNITALVKYYRENGDFRAAVRLLETEHERDFAAQKYAYLAQIADNARLAGDKEKELAARREYVQNLCDECEPTPDDAAVRDYFKTLTENGTAGRTELSEFAQSEILRDRHPKVQLQLINFLYAQNERELAHAAIKNSSFSKVWKNSRQAQISLAFEEFAAGNKEYFRAALVLKPIGELIKDEPQSAEQLTGEDWFRLAHNYGKWLDKAGKEIAKDATPEDFLPALTEKRPEDANEQARLAEWYLERKNAQRAMAHAQIALEIEPTSKKAIAVGGAAHLLAGDEAKALAVWKQIIAGDNPDFGFYFLTLKKYGRAAVARAALEPRLIEHLKDADFDEETLKSEIGHYADSFGDNKKPEIAAAQAAALLKIAAAAPDNSFLPEFVIKESLVATNRLAPFYELLIKNSADSNDTDYNYTALVQSNLTVPQAEAALDVSENYAPAAPENDKIKWQQEYLNYLFETRQTAKAGNLIGAIETLLADAYARPAWLRLARLRFELQTQPKANVLPAFKEFVGINPNAETVIAPSVTRLNDAVKVLQMEKQEKLAAELRMAVYARSLALEKFDAATFSGLANLAFKRGDVKFGMKLLQMMVDLTDDDKRDVTSREIAALETIKTYAVDPALVAESEAENSLKRPDALRVAAEMAAQFEQPDAAIDFRQQLLISVPTDAVNRIELAKILARQNRFEEAANILAAVVANPEIARQDRWRAIWTAAQISGESQPNWDALNSQLQNAAAADSETRLALAALEKWNTGRTAEALDELAKTVDKTANLEFLFAFIAKDNGQIDAALNSFLTAQKGDADSELSFVINTNKNETMRQIMMLCAAHNRQRAALKLAEKYQNLQDELLLELLSKAAEETNDYKKAITFAERRKEVLTEPNDIQAAETRIAALQIREKEIVAPTTDFKVNENNVSE